MKQEKQKQTEKKEVSIAPINITNKFIDVNNVVQAPLFRVLSRGQERKKDVKLYSYQKTYDIKEKKEVFLHWRFDISEELSIFDFKMYLYLINKYIQKDFTRYLDFKELGLGDEVVIDYLAITSNSYVCTVPLSRIGKDLGYIKLNNEDKQRILDSLIRLQKVFVFFSDVDLRKSAIPSKMYSKNMFYHYIIDNTLTFRIDNNITNFLLKYCGINSTPFNLQFAHYQLDDLKKLKHEVSIALYNYLNSKNVSYSIDGLREVIYGFSNEKDKTYYRQRSSIKKGLEELKKIWDVVIDDEKVFVNKNNKKGS